MTIFEMMEELQACGDIDYELCPPDEENDLPCYYVDINDYDTLEDEWQPDPHSYIKPKLVRAFETALKEQALRKSDDWEIEEYYFKDYYFHLHYASYDI